MENPILFLVIVYAVFAALPLMFVAISWIGVVWNPDETNWRLAKGYLPMLAIAPIWPLFILVVIGIWIFRLIKLIIREAQ